MKIETTVRLSTSKETLVFKNPILTASGTYGFGEEFMPYGDITTLGGIVVKGLSLMPRAGNPLPRIAETSSGLLNAVGLQNDGVVNFVHNILPRLPFHQVPIIANIYASSVEEFAELSSTLDAAYGLAALEVNISCPNVKSGGVLFGQDPDLAYEVTKSVCDNVSNLPVIVKLSPNVTSISTIAEAVESAGADAISLINTVSGIAVDVKKRQFLLGNTVGGLSGPAIKPIALRCLHEVRKKVKLPIIAMGGICNTMDVLEFILLGASAVQIGTANFIDPQRAFSIVEELPQTLESLGYTSLEHFKENILS